MISKDDILKEIRKTAKENNGKPLGQKAFKRVTGITPFDCSRYWAKFSDAIQEAGFLPNEPWTRYPDELLIKKTIEKIRKYGRYPTLNELFVENNKGDDFPFHIFKKRGQDYVVRKVIDYCNNKDGFEDIIEACRPIIKKLDRKEKFEDVGTRGRIGEVYLYKHGHFNQYKIGKTFDSVRRGSEIRIQLPERVILIHTIKTVDPSGIEAYWHKRFEAKRINGEWYDLNRTDISEFKGWKRIV